MRPLHAGWNLRSVATVGFSSTKLAGPPAKSRHPEICILEDAECHTLIMLKGRLGYQLGWLERCQLDSFEWHIASNRADGIVQYKTSSVWVEKWVLETVVGYLCANLVTSRNPDMDPAKALKCTAWGATRLPKTHRSTRGVASFLPIKFICSLRQRARIWGSLLTTVEVLSSTSIHHDCMSTVSRYRQSWGFCLRSLSRFREKKSGNRSDAFFYYSLSLIIR